MHLWALAVRTGINLIHPATRSHPLLVVVEIINYCFIYLNQSVLRSENKLGRKIVKLGLGQQKFHSEALSYVSMTL